MSDVTGVLQGASGGAASGLTFGPIGSVVGAGIGAAASLAGGIMSNRTNTALAAQSQAQNFMMQKDAQAFAAGQNDNAHDWQKQMLDRENEFNVTAAQKQMDFQERMSSTAYQRQVADMRAAGLNPILAAGHNAGASTPPGSGIGSASAPGTASGGAALASVQPARVENVVGPAVSNALQLFTALQASDRIAAEIRNIEADTSNKMRTSDLLEQQTIVTKNTIDRVLEETDLTKAQKDRVRAEIEAIFGRTAPTQAQMAELGTRSGLNQASSARQVAETDTLYGKTWPSRVQMGRDVSAGVGNIVGAVRDYVKTIRRP